MKTACLLMFGLMSLSVESFATEAPVLKAAGLFVANGTVFNIAPNGLNVFSPDAKNDQYYPLDSLEGKGRGLAADQNNFYIWELQSLLTVFNYRNSTAERIWPFPLSVAQECNEDRVTVSDGKFVYWFCSNSYSDKAALYRLDLKTGETTKTKLDSPSDIHSRSTAVALHRGSIYFGDEVSSEIRRIDLDTHEVRTVAKDVIKANAMAVVGEDIYLASSYGYLTSALLKVELADGRVSKFADCAGYVVALSSGGDFTDELYFTAQVEDPITVRSNTLQKLSIEAAVAHTSESVRGATQPVCVRTP